MNSEIESLKTDLLSGMQSYLDKYNAGYTTNDIQQCGKIVDTYITNMKNLKDSEDEEAILAEVQSVVEKLTDLNDACDDPIIETDQREIFCDIINMCAVEAGFPNEDDEDLTEEWREW